MDGKNSTFKLEAGGPACSLIIDPADFIFMLEIGEHFLAAGGTATGHAAGTC